VECTYSLNVSVVEKNSIEYDRYEFKIYVAGKLRADKVYEIKRGTSASNIPYTPPAYDPPVGDVYGVVDSVSNDDGVIEFNISYEDAEGNKVAKPNEAKYIQLDGSSDKVVPSDFSVNGDTHSFDNENYIITKLSGGRVRVVPKQAGLKTVSFSIGGSAFTINVDDIENSSEPLVLKRILKSDEALRASYQFAQSAEIYNFGGNRIVERYSGAVTKTNEDGVSYTELQDYQRWNSQGYTIAVDEVQRELVCDRQQRKIMW
jgi:hypothetical protein